MRKKLPFTPRYTIQWWYLIFGTMWTAGIGGVTTKFTNLPPFREGRGAQGVIDAMVKHTAVYFAAVGGAGALLAKCVKAARPVAYADLGAEAITELTVEKFPAIVATDCRGTDLYSRKP